MKQATNIEMSQKRTARNERTVEQRKRVLAANRTSSINRKLTSCTDAEIIALVNARLETNWRIINELYYINAYALTTMHTYIYTRTYVCVNMFK